MLYKAYQLLFVLPIGLLVTFLASVLGSLACMLFGERVGSYWPGRLWSAIIVRLLLLPVSVEGRENLQPGQSYVFVANHQGPFDIFLIYGFLRRPFKWVMKKSLRKIPFVGYFCEKAGFIFVDKTSRITVKQTMQDASAKLQDGASIVIFPEGARSFTGHMGQFRRGGFLLAEHAGLPICPLTIDGSFDVLRRQDGFNFVNWHRLRLVIHKPVNYGPTTLEDTYRTIMSALPEKYQGYVENPDQ